MSEADDLRAEVAALRAKVEVMDEYLSKTMTMNKHLYETVFALASLTVVIPRVVKPSSEEDGEAARERAAKLISDVHEGLQSSYNAYWPGNEGADGSEH